jgi:hypothetical protein
VTKPDASEAKKLTASAISSLVPKRPAGTDATYARLTSSVTSAWRSTGTKPGATVFTVMPKGASPRAQLRVRPICALFAVA